MAETIQHHPLMFIFRDIISGDGFLAGITVSGKALMLYEDERWCIYGVRPGALAASGETPQGALLDFRKRFKEVLFDIADESRTFEAFRQEVERFFYEPDLEDERRWEDALIAVRTGNFVPESPFSELPKQSPEIRPTQITVERLDGESKRFMPSDNVADVYLFPTAA